MAALKQASVVIVPTDGSLLLSTVAKDQIDELNRMGYCPRFVELHLESGKKTHRICRDVRVVHFDFGEYITSTNPVSLKRKDWDGALKWFAPGSGGMEAGTGVEEI